MRGPRSVGRAAIARSPLPRLSVCSCLAAPTTASLHLWQFKPGTLSQVQAASCGLAPLLTYCPPFVPHLPGRTSTLRRRLASLLAIHRSQLSRLGSFAVARVLYERIAASCLNSLYRHPASVRCVDVPPSMATHRLRSRRPVFAPSLRCGLRSSFLVTAPSLRSVATTRLHATSLPFTVGNVFQ